MRKHRSLMDDGEINITPMLDVVFILLIFFIVTTSFVKETALDVSRPARAPDKTETDGKPVLLEIDASGNYRLAGRVIVPAIMGAALSEARARREDGVMLVAVDRRAPTHALVTALDAGTRAGFDAMSVTARSEP